MPIPFDPKDVVYFGSPAEFRRWLAKHHQTADVLWVGYHKKATGKPTMTWPESVDEALCYGWIDGIRKRVDDDRYTIRFTPRRPRSIWSAVNVRRVKALEAEGRMTDAGRAAFRAMTPERSGIYSFEQPADPKLPAALVRRFRANKKAWAHWDKQPPGRKRQITWWLISAKKEETREKRFAYLLEACEAGRAIGTL